MSVKHELRQMFDQQSSFHYLDGNSKLEDGLLEKILNLSVLNPIMLNDSNFSIIAVQTLEYKRRLYWALNNNDIVLDSSAALIITGDNSLYSPNDYTFTLNKSPRPIMLTPSTIDISITYAAKYYGLDTLIVSDYDAKTLKAEFKIKKEIIMILCLGNFSPSTPFNVVERKQSYSDMVTEM